LEKYYSLQDRATSLEKAALGAPSNCTRVHCAWKDPELGHVCIMARKTGEHRVPLKDEWFLRGKPLRATRAGADFDDWKYPIVKLVRVRRVTRFEEV
jgi:hypothetical protein